MKNHCSFLPFLSVIFRQHGLTEREIAVAHLIILEGLDNQEISERIFRAPVTVKKCTSRIYQKFGVKNRTELMALFIRRLCTLYSNELAKNQSDVLPRAV